MPTYAWKCEQCGKVWEEKGTYQDTQKLCPRAREAQNECYGMGYKIPVMPAKTTVGKYGKGGGR